MTKRIIVPVIFFLLLLVVTACDPGYDYKRVVENTSDHDIKIIQMPKECSPHYAIKDSIVINRHSTGTIGVDSGHGSIPNFENCESCAQSIQVLVLDTHSLTFTLDLGDNSIWKYERLTKSFKGGGSRECRIKITNEHFK